MLDLFKVYQHLSLSMSICTTLPGFFFTLIEFHVSLTPPPSLYAENRLKRSLTVHVQVRRVTLSSIMKGEQARKAIDRFKDCTPKKLTVRTWEEADTSETEKPEETHLKQSRNVSGAIC